MYGKVSTREVQKTLVNVLQTRPLQFSTSDINVVPATPVKRRGKCMSRRTGQDGHIEASGKWWVVRWWMDVAGQGARRHMRAKICPVSGPGHLSKAEMERRAREIVAESGADTLEHFDKVVKQAQGVTFREQTKWWLDHIQRRKRKPIAPATLELWKGCLEKWVNPNIGYLPLADVNNSALKVLACAGICPCQNQHGIAFKLFKIQEKHGRGGGVRICSGIENTQIIEKASCSDAQNAEIGP